MRFNLINVSFKFEDEEPYMVFVGQDAEYSVLLETPETLKTIVTSTLDSLGEAIDSHTDVLAVNFVEIHDDGEQVVEVVIPATNDMFLLLCANFIEVTSGIVSTFVEMEETRIEFNTIIQNSF